MLDFVLVKDPVILHLTYFGEGVVFQTSYNKDTESSQSNLAIYCDSKSDAHKYMITNAARMLNEGWEIPDED